MQVKLTSDTLAQNHAFQSASYSFSLFYTGTTGFARLIVLVSCFIFVYHWVRTVHKMKTRRKHTS